MSGPIQADTEATLASLRSDLLAAAGRVAAKGRSRRRHRVMLILTVTALVPTVALATTDTNPLDWLGHADSRIGFGFVVDPAGVAAGPTYPALTCTIGGRDCAPWPRVVCVPQTPAAPNCDTSRAPRPGRSQQGYAFLELAEPVRAVTPTATLRLIASRRPKTAQETHALVVIAAAVRHESPAFWSALNRLLSVQAFTIEFFDARHAERILVPRPGIPGFLRCLPGRRPQCAPLTPGDHVPAGTALYEALPQTNWVSVPRPPQDALLYQRAFMALLGRQITRDDMWAMVGAFAASDSQTRIGGSEGSGGGAPLTPTATGR